MTGNPFAADIYPDGLPAAAGALALHGGALEELRAIIDSAGQRRQASDAMDGGGTVVLLRAPRAGFGKSHLLARLAEEMGDRAFVVPVPFDRERAVLWSALLWQVLETFHHGKIKELTQLDLVARRVFAMVNQRMIVEKQIPCAHPEEALAALEKRFVDLFDFANPAQPVARWFGEHFERLLPFAAQATGQIAGLTEDVAAHWLRVLCAYAQAHPDGDTVRWESLRWSVLQPSGPALTHGGMNMVSAGPTGEAAARERAVEFCRMAAAVRPLVLVFDDLDLFHQQAEPVQRIAGCIAELRRLLSRSVQVLSVNQDLWAQTFLKSLPSAIEDRLTGNQITLGTTDREQALQLIRSRISQAGLSETVASAFLQRLNLSAYFSQEAGRLVSPRALLRYAAGIWDAFARGGATQPPEDSGTVPEMPGIPLKVADAPMFRTSPPQHPAGSMPEPSPAADPAFARLRETLQRLLTPLRQEDEPQSHEPFITDFRQQLSSGVILRDPEPAATPVTPPQRPVAQEPAPPSPEQILHRRFQQLRSHFLTAPWLAVDQDRLFHLLKIAGGRLAIVKWIDHPLPGSPGQSAGAWAGPDGEILFGSEPYEDRTYWSALVHFARTRASQGRPCRLVVFSAMNAPVNLSSWMPPDEIIGARTHFLDVQAVDQPVLATLYAADELMRDAERGSLGATPGETFAMLVPHLEFLWKQVTRRQVA